MSRKNNNFISNNNSNEEKENMKAEEINFQEKSLNVVNGEDAKTKISDIEFKGDPDLFQLVCKASSKSQGWMKSTKACNVYGGCLVQVSTQQRNLDGSYAIAESVTFAPHIMWDKESEVFKRTY